MTQEDAKVHTAKPGQHLLDELKWVHRAIRRDLDGCKKLADEVATGAEAGYVRQQIESLKNNSTLWRLRVNCLTYCRFVHTHHRLEDVAIFPGLRRANPELGPVVDRLEADHQKVSDHLDEIEAAAKSLGAEDSALARERLVDGLEVLGADLLEHLEFEEESIAPTVLQWRRWPMM